MNSRKVDRVIVVLLFVTVAVLIGNMVLETVLATREPVPTNVISSLLIPALALIVAYLAFRSNTDAGTFSAITQIHQSIAGAYDWRGKLHASFSNALLTAVQELGTHDSRYQSWAQNSRVDVHAVLSPPVEANESMLRQLNDSLGEHLEPAERVLLSFDAIALPATLGIPAANAALVAYKPVLERTAKLLIPFVAVQMVLRADPSYKWHYIQILHRLNLTFRNIQDQAAYEALCQASTSAPVPMSTSTLTVPQSPASESTQ